MNPLKSPKYCIYLKGHGEHSLHIGTKKHTL